MMDTYWLTSKEGVANNTVQTEIHKYYQVYCEIPSILNVKTTKCLFLQDEDTEPAFMRSLRAK